MKQSKWLNNISASKKKTFQVYVFNLILYMCKILIISLKFIVIYLSVNKRCVNFL